MASGVLRNSHCICRSLRRGKYSVQLFSGKEIAFAIFQFRLVVLPYIGVLLTKRASANRGSQLSYHLTKQPGSRLNIISSLPRNSKFQIPKPRSSHSELTSPTIFPVLSIIRTVAVLLY